MNPRVAVVGGGIAGLATAFRLQRAGAEPVVLERASTHGGVIAPPVAVGDLALEPGPDSLAARKPWGVDALPGPRADADPAGRDGRVPLDRRRPGAVPARSGIRDPGRRRRRAPMAGSLARGRVRALADLVKRTRRDGVEETLGELLRRRLGDEATDRAIAPLLAGLHAGDVDGLSAAATFPELLAWEASQGSLIRGAQAATRAAGGAEPGPLFLRPDGGCGSWSTRSPRRSATASGPASEVDRRHGRDGRARGRRLGAGRRGRPRVRRPGVGDPARRRARPPGSRRSAPSRPASCSSSTRRGPPSALPDGTGFVVPRGRAPMTAATFVSRKWPDARVRRPGGGPLLRGGRGRRGRARRADDGHRRGVRAASRRRRSISPRPTASRVHRWWRAMPQYERRASRPRPRDPRGAAGGYLRRRERVRRRRRVRLARAAEETAEQVLAHAGAPRPGMEEPA